MKCTIYSWTILCSEQLTMWKSEIFVVQINHFIVQRLTAAVFFICWQRIIIISKRRRKKKIFNISNKRIGEFLLHWQHLATLGIKGNKDLRKQEKKALSLRHSVNPLNNFKYHAVLIILIYLYCLYYLLFWLGLFCAW